MRRRSFMSWPTAVSYTHLLRDSPFGRLLGDDLPLLSNTASHRPAALCLLELNKLLFPSPHFLGFEIVIVLTINALCPKVNCVFWRLFEKIRAFFRLYSLIYKILTILSFTFSNREFLF